MKSINWLEDKDGYPWSTYIPFGIVGIVTCVFFPLLFALGLYLALWMATKGHRVSLASFVMATLAGVADILAPYLHWSHGIQLTLDRLTIALLIAATFVLRSEIMTLYGEYGEHDVYLWRRFTLFFGIAYLNYSLRPDGHPFGYRPKSVHESDSFVSLKLDSR